MAARSFLRPYLGSLQQAAAVAERARKVVPAYTRFVGEGAAEEFASLPPTDKKTYVGPAAFADLLADDYEDTFSVFRSSGSSGQSAFWPQLNCYRLPGGAGDKSLDIYRLAHQHRNVFFQRNFRPKRVHT